MAKGLDELIEFLLEDIALHGSRGVTINEIVSLVSSFYNEPENDSASKSDRDSANTASGVTIDRYFLSKIWKWLGQHADVLIGDDRKYNKVSLDDLDREFPGYLDASLKDNHQPSENDSDSNDSHPPAKPAQARSANRRSQKSQGPRIRLNEERIHLAICGHPPDPSKVVPLEFDLLSHIAAARSNGILQGELVRRTGQDKRSVPKRTDALQSKGYIVKEVVYQKGTRTSRLILNRFSNRTANDVALAQDQTSQTQRGSTVRDVIRRIFNVLSDQNLLPQTKLMEELNLESSAETSVLQKIIRRLERLKCVKRVRTAVGPSATAGDLRQFVQLLRPAEPEDLENFDTETLSLNHSIQHLVSLVRPEAQNEATIEIPSEDHAGERSENLRYMTRWNPDRFLPNVLLDAARLTGADGLSNSDGRRMITGVFVRRTIESLLVRLSWQSLVVQPPHLQHLAIIRRGLTVDGSIQFLHYSWDIFRRLIDGDKIDVTLIPGAKQALKAITSDEGAVDDQTSLVPSKLDRFGFPQGPPTLQLRHGEVGLPDLVKAAAAWDVAPRNGEPILVKEGEDLCLKFRDDLPRTVVNKIPRKAQPQTQPPMHDDDPEREIAIGRPRKYLRGTEKFWRRQFKQATLEAGTAPAKGSKGVMDDPAGLALYARRPAGFDETLLEAFSAGLPVPAFPCDIHDAWIQSTRVVLNRSADGVYISPPGSRSDSTKQDSQIMIIKTPALSLVDFNDRRTVYPFRFISSSASHSFAFRRHYPKLEAKRPLPSSTPGRARRTKQTGRSVKKKSWPKMGVFYEDVSLARASLPGTLADLDFTPNAFSDTTDEESGLPFQSDQETQRSSPVLRNLSMSATQGPARRRSTRLESLESQQRGVDRASTVSAPIPARSGSMAMTPPIQSSRKRKLTQKAVELVESSQGQSLQLFSKSRSVSFDDPTGGFRLQARRKSASEAQKPSSQRMAGQLPSLGGQPLIAQQTTPPSAMPPTGILVGQPVGGVQLRHGNAAGESSGDRLDPIVASNNNNNYVTTSDFPVAVNAINPSAASIISSFDTQPQQQLISAETDYNISRASVPLAMSTFKTSSLVAKRHRVVESTDAEDSGEESRPRTRQKEGKQRYTQGARALCRKIIIELISDASGVVPNDPYTLRRVSGPRWQEAGEEDRPLLKTIKSAIKTLCADGKLKQVMFTFRGKAGVMLKRAVIFLPKISPLSQQVEDIKQHIIDAEPTDYIPPEWRVEAARIPLAGKLTQSRTPKIESTPTGRRRASSTSTNDSRSTITTRSTRSYSRLFTPSPSPPATPATGFLTLKVPSLGSLPAVQVHNWRSKCPVYALLSDTSASNPWKSTSVLPPRRGRGLRKPAGRSIVWSKGEPRNFPSSLQDILQLPDLKLDIEDFTSDDLNWQRFACEIEGVRAWEEQKAEFLQQRSMYAFIDHVVPAALYMNSVVPANVEFANLVQFDDNADELEVAFPPSKSWPNFLFALEASPGTMSRIAGLDVDERGSMPPPSQEEAIRRSIRPSKRKALIDEALFEPEPKRRRKQNRGSSTPTAKRKRPSSRTSVAPKLSRGVQYLRSMPEELIYRVAVSVIVIRTLAGGVESFIDWPLVMTLFPDEREDFIRGRWRTLSSRYRQDIRGLAENLQWKYLQALEAGEVASVNFQDLRATDWSAIVEWALKSLDKFNTKQVEDLPQSRDIFLGGHTMEFQEPRRLYSLLSYNNNTTTPIREEVLSSIPFGIVHCRDSRAETLMPTPTLQYTPRYELEIANPDLRLAKSWALATILTPESTFDAASARAKISSLAPTPSECEALLLRSLKVLQDEKIIQRALTDRKSQQVSSMRTWGGSRKLYDRFEERRMINAGMLRRAAAYKLDVLDEAFARGESVVFEKEGIIHDGEMVAVLNLIAMGHVRPRPGKDVPNTRYGLDHERVGYRTKLMDKKLLGFSVEIHSVEGYVFGDPKAGARRIAVPRGGTDEPKGLIPPWIDIHGNLQTKLWEMFLVGAIGLVSQMPGTTALELSRAFGHALDEGEVELVMEWCIQGGFATLDSRSRGYETTNWWWLCIDREMNEE